MGLGTISQASENFVHNDSDYYEKQQVECYRVQTLISDPIKPMNKMDLCIKSLALQ